LNAFLGRPWLNPDFWTLAIEFHDAAKIAGLYAAGEMVGGIFYFNYPSGAGLVSGAVFGRLAGASAARSQGLNF
jgi:succinate dehydrogenase/fumarate reductase flavoprotein subunit